MHAEGGGTVRQRSQNGRLSGIDEGRQRGCSSTLISAPQRTLNRAGGPNLSSDGLIKSECRLRRNLPEQESMTCVRGFSIARVVIVVRTVK
jgi:hypothetical protein